jgi:HlyD family secretion protein
MCFIEIADPRMKRKRIGIGILVVAIAAGAAYFVLRARASTLVLTGVVTTHEVVASSQVAGQIRALLAKEGDAVTTGQLLATIAPDELRADSAYYAQAAEGASSAVHQNEASLRMERQQTDSQIHQAEAAQASAEAQLKSAQADLDHAKLTFDRQKKLLQSGASTQEDYDQARTTYDATVARVESLGKQVDVARAALATAHANAEQVVVRQSQLQASQHESAAAAAQQQKADVRLAYTEIHAPIDGIIDVRAARQGEVVVAGQPIVTIVNPDDLWVRVDVEETYIDQIKLGDHLTIRLPSGVERDGTVFYRGVDAGFATQRDVSRTKRDIRTFEVRLRADNRDRRLAVGETAYVLLPVPH